MVGTHYSVTKRFIHANRIGVGGWTSRQLQILGESWPPSKGWIDRAARRQITIDEKREFIAIGAEHREDLAKKKAKSPNDKPKTHTGIVRGKKRISKMTVPFGKFKGREWSRVPSDYLRFILSEFPEKAKMQKQARVAAEVILRMRGEDIPAIQKRNQQKPATPAEASDQSDLDMEFRQIAKFS